MMTNKDYVVKITNATGVQLTIITFELCILNIDNSIKILEDKKEIDKKIFIGYIDKSKSFLDELILSLNFEYEISKSLLELYLYVNEKLVQSKIKMNIEKLEESKKILSEIKEGFVEVEKNVESKVNEVENKEKIYAGLTYSKNELNEYIDDRDGKQYKA